MRVLVTGSSGHVGGAIATHLAARGYEVIGLSRRTNSNLAKSITQISADIVSSNFVEQTQHDVTKCDVLVHAAANLDKQLYSHAITSVNGAGTQNVLQLAENWIVKLFVYISGVAVIGKPREIPITEGHPCEPLTAYHASKLYGEQLASIAARGGIPVATLRLSAPVGPGTPPGRIMRVFVEHAMAGRSLVLNGEGNRKQNYVDVRDVAAAVESCVLKSVTGLFNIGSQHAISNRQLAEQCIETLKSTSTIDYSGKPDPEEGDDWTVSIQRARLKFGYFPRHSTESSIEAIAREVT